MNYGSFCKKTTQVIKKKHIMQNYFSFRASHIYPGAFRAAHISGVYNSFADHAVPSETSNR